MPVIPNAPARPPARRKHRISTSSAMSTTRLSARIPNVLLSCGQRVLYRLATASCAFAARSRTLPRQALWNPGACDREFQLVPQPCLQKLRTCLRELLQSCRVRSAQSSGELPAALRAMLQASSRSPPRPRVFAATDSSCKAFRKPWAECHELRPSVTVLPRRAHSPVFRRV